MAGEEAGVKANPARRASRDNRRLVEVPAQRATSSVSRGLPSTRASIGLISAAASAARGAIEKPHIPASTVVTPWKQDGLSLGSQKTCTS